MSERADRRQQPATDDRSHEACLSLLAEYATAQSLGEQPAQRYPAVAAHLAQCATCRDELDQLLALVEPIYAGEIVAVAEAPHVDLSFLQPSGGASSLGAPAAPTPLDELRRVVVVFSERLLAALQQPTLAHSARGQSLFRYMPDPQPPGNLRLTVEVFASADAAQQVAVQILVDLADRGPLEQGGITVTLTMGEQRYTGQTEATGAVTFPAVPLAGLAEMRIEVEAPGPQ